MTVNSYLAVTASKAILSNSEKSSIQRSIDTLAQRLAAWFGNNISDQFQFGSSTRGTILPRKIDEKSDIDYMIVFANDDANDPKTYISQLRRFAEAKYSSSEIHQSHPTVVLSLNHIKFDLVPAIYSYYTGYSIPAPLSGFKRWISTSPNDFNGDLTEANQMHDNLIKPMIRLLKYWNANSGYVFESFGLEENLVSKLGWSDSLKGYVFDAFDRIYLPWEAADWRRSKLDQAKELVIHVQYLERMGETLFAEREIKNLIPAI